MKKEGGKGMSRQESKDNLVMFPGLERLLLEKGMEMIQEKKFRQAIELLDQAHQLDDENSETYIGLILAHFESGNSVKAKELAEGMLKKGIGDYIQVVDLYIMIMVQLSEYDQIITTLEALLEEKHVPKDKYEHFSKLLHFSRKMNEEHVDGEVSEPVFKEIEAGLDLFSYQDPKEQMLIAARLAKENVRPYINEIKQYLESTEGHPFQKSLLLNILREQDYNFEVKVEKFGMEESYIPSTLPTIQEIERLQEVTVILESELESEDPILFENVKSLVERNFFLLYPFNPKPEDSKAWAAAFHYLVKVYYGQEESLGDYADTYRTSDQEMEEVVELIKRLEEISYPIL